MLYSNVTESDKDGWVQREDKVTSRKIKIDHVKNDCGIKNRLIIRGASGDNNVLFRWIGSLFNDLTKLFYQLFCLDNIFVYYNK